MTIQGKSVYSGVAIGRLAIYRKSENQVKREKIADTAKEVKRFEDAKDTVIGYKKDGVRYHFLDTYDDAANPNKE